MNNYRTPWIPKTMIQKSIHWPNESGPSISQSKVVGEENERWKTTLITTPFPFPHTWIKSLTTEPQTISNNNDPEVHSQTQWIWTVHLPIHASPGRRENGRWGFKRLETEVKRSVDVITRWSELGSSKKVGDADADSALIKIRDFEKQKKKKRNQNLEDGNWMREREREN